MAFFRPTSLNDPSFTPLFRLLQDFDNYTREVQGGDQEPGVASHKHRGRTQFITPKFDLHETQETYELHGDLPGVEKDNVTIEFTDPQTMVIRGHVERTYSSGTPPAGLVGSGKKKSAITEAGENHSHKATVEDDPESAPKNDQVVKHKEEKSESGEAHGSAHRPVEKFWVSERTFGQFSRAFSFPSRVDHDNIRASLNNGVLNVSVPKAKKQEARRIAIN